jgi:hypothetical protein
MHCIEQLFGMWQATKTLAHHASTIGRSDQRALRQSSGDPTVPRVERNSPRIAGSPRRAYATLEEVSCGLSRTGEAPIYRQ